MDVHQTARATPRSRLLIMGRLAEGWTGKAVAAGLGVDPRTVRKWRDRFAAESEAGLLDRSSRPYRSPTRLDQDGAGEIERLRRERLSGPAIARQARRPVSTVGAWLRRLGLGRLSTLDPKPAVIRYERQRPGELIHIDTKKLGRIDGIGHRITDYHTGMVRNRGIGFDHLHVAVDDASRLAYTELMPDDRKESAMAFLSRALAWFGQHGVRVERVMSDNSLPRTRSGGSACRSREFAAAIQPASLKHIRIRPYTPRTIDRSAVDPVPKGTARHASRRGKAERFIQSSLRKWAYA